MWAKRLRKIGRRLSGAVKKKPAAKSKKLCSPPYLHAYRSYDEYVRIQNGNKKKITFQWAREENIKYYASYFLARGTPSFGLCHGTRFSEALGCLVLGTEIADRAEQQCEAAVRQRPFPSTPRGVLGVSQCLRKYRILARLAVGTLL